MDTNTMVGLLQLVVMMIAVAKLFAMVGRRDAELARATSDLEKLGLIVTDLAKAQVANSCVDGSHGEQLRDISRRLERLERERVPR
jgi:hypothetical protein